MWVAERDDVSSQKTDFTVDLIWWGSPQYVMERYPGILQHVTVCNLFM